MLLSKVINFQIEQKYKDNLINLNDYIEIINNDLITYVILCGINFDKELLNNININKKINKTVDNLEKSFINKYSIKYNLIIYNEQFESYNDRRYKWDRIRVIIKLIQK